MRGRMRRRSALRRGHSRRGGHADTAPARRRPTKNSPLKGLTKERQWQKVERIKILKYHESVSKMNKDLLCKS